MIEALIGKIGLKLSMSVFIALALAALLAFAGYAFWSGMDAISDMQKTAAAAARAERDAHWKSEIEKSNAEVERRRTAQAIAAAQEEAKTGAELMRLRSNLATLEARNAALPGGDRRGLGRDRVRLLNDSARRRTDSENGVRASAGPPKRERALRPSGRIARPRFDRSGDGEVHGGRSFGASGM